MTITFYGKLATMLGREIELSVQVGATVGCLRDRIVETHPKAAQSLHDQRVRACIGNAFVTDDHLLAAGDEIAFLSPVSGG